MVGYSVLARGRFGAARVLSAVFAAVMPVVLAAVLAVAGFDSTAAVAQAHAQRLDDDSPRTGLARRRKPRPQAERNTDGHRSPKTADKPDDIPKPRRPLFAVISIADQHVSIYNHDGLVVRSPVSTGVPGHPTPKGIFTIIGRERYHRSNIYSGAPMPFMQRVTWSGIAMHLGVVPGYPASHGCIRLPAGFAAQLWGMTRIGERIVISREEAAPTEIAHPLLPAPKMRAQTAANTTAANATAPIAGSTQSPAVVAPPALLNPHQYAEQLKVKAAAEAVAAAKAIKETLAAASARQPEAALAAADLEAAEAAHALAQAKADAAARAYETAAATATVARDTAAAAAKDAAAMAKTNAGAALADAAAKLETAKKASAAKAAEWADAVRRSNEAGAASAAAANGAKEALRRLSPVSVLVSKKDQRVYVRQGLAPIFDAPAGVRDPQTPLGSHLYIATAATDDGASLKWQVVSMPAQPPEPPGGRRKKKASGEETAGAPMQPLRPESSPAEALERVEIAQDVRDRIAELLWTGGSLIVSDQPPSYETGAVGTDLTVKVR